MFRPSRLFFRLLIGHAPPDRACIDPLLDLLFERLR
jgi:hypothetical protein